MRTQLELFSSGAAQAQLPRDASHRVVSTPNKNINFVLRRSHRRTIGFTVDDNGLRVNAPKWLSLSQIDAAIIERSSWILEKLEQRQQRLDKQAHAQTLLQHNGQIPYMGVYIKLKIAPKTIETKFVGNLDAPNSNDYLYLALPSEPCQQRISDTVNSWLQQQASWWFEQRLNYFLDKSGHKLKSWRLSGATTRWGSCTSQKRILLNWRLIHLKHEIIDYVIAHEVAHLSEMNHSIRFWQEVKKLYPNYSQAQLELKRHRPGTLPLL